MGVERVDFYSEDEYQQALQMEQDDERRRFEEQEAQREDERAERNAVGYEHKDDAPIDPPDDREISPDDIPF